MFIKRILTPLLIILLLFSIVVIGAPNYGNVGPTTEFGFDIKIEDEIVCEGSIVDEFETTFIITNPTVDRTYTFPDSDQTYDLSLYYLKTEMDSFSELQAIIADKTLVNTTDKLSDFAATTSAELAGVISDETGSGLLVYGTSPNITTPTGIVRGDVGLGNVENLKVKLDGTAPPVAATDDITLGYAVGSRWFDVTNDKEYVCLDNTDGAAVWTETTGAGGGATTFTGLTDTPANYAGSSLKHVRVNVGETALEFVTLGGGGDMLKATYDTDDDGDIDVASGGTEKSLWTQYAIPYLSDTTVFGEIPIGTAGYVLTVNGTTDGYTFTDVWTEAENTAAGYIAEVVEDTTPELGGELSAGAHSIGFTLQTAIGDGTTTIDWKLGNKFEFTFGAFNEVFTFTAPTNPGNFMLWLIQDGTGSRTVTWPGMVRWPGGTAPTLTTAANAVDIIAFVWNGTNYDGVASFAFATP